MDRRTFLRRVAAASGAALFASEPWARLAGFGAPLPGDGPYGPLLAADANGLQLPVGFTSRLIAVTGQAVGSSNHIWHSAPDGGACFSAPNGGWVYVSNSEVSAGGGGVGAVAFNADGSIANAYTILSGTSRNCAGGPTPWGTWLSGEESGSGGRVYECQPLAPGQGVQRPLLGSFNHEAAVVDPATGHVYLTEDDPSGRLYRFEPTNAGDLTAGVLKAASVSAGVVSWVTTSTLVPDRNAATTAFNGGEGEWIADGSLFFTTKGDKRVWELVLATQQLSVLYDGNATPGAALNAVDNLTVHGPSGDIYIAEDGGNMEVCLIGAVGTGDQVAPFLRFVGHGSSEVAGVAFSPDQTRLYVSSQRGTDGVTGRTYEISGPFRTVVTPPPPSETLVAAGSVWRYLDNGSNQGTAWSGYFFNDSAWAAGAAPLGYGDPMTTTISFGPSSTAKYITTYFRRTFQATHGFSALTLNLRRDDGAVVYVNGAEVARSNMPTGTITSTTLSPVAMSGADETTYFSIPITANLYNGTNVIAVEIHQQSASSSDLGFDLSLVGVGNTGALTNPPTNPTATLVVDTDTHVRGGTNATRNYGTATTLETRTNSNASNTRWSYLKIDTASFAPIVTSAKLRLYALNAATGTSTTELRPVAVTNWGETTMTWNNRPATGTALATFSVSSRTAAWLEFDVTAYVVAERAAGRTVVSFALVQPANSVQLNVSSGESVNPARLVLTGASPTGGPLPGGIAG